MTYITTTDKKTLKDLLVKLEVSTVDFNYPRKNQETFICFPKYKNKKDLVIRNVGHCKYDLLYIES